MDDQLTTKSTKIKTLENLYVYDTLLRLSSSKLIPLIIHQSLIQPYLGIGQSQYYHEKAILRRQYYYWQNVHSTKLYYQIDNNVGIIVLYCK